MTPAQERLREHIAAAAGVAASSIMLDTPLVKNRILTSLMILDLILLIEELRAAPLDPASIRPESFRDLAAIANAFLGGSAHG